MSGADPSQLWVYGMSELMSVTGWALAGMVLGTLMLVLPLYLLLRVDVGTKEDR